MTTAASQRPTNVRARIIAVSMAMAFILYLDRICLAEIVKAAGADVLGGTAAPFAARMRRDTQRLGEVIRISGAKAN